MMVRLGLVLVGVAAVTLGCDFIVHTNNPPASSAAANHDRVRFSRHAGAGGCRVVR